MIRRLSFPNYDDNGERIKLYDINTMPKSIVFLDFDGVIIPNHSNSRWDHNLNELRNYLTKRYNDERFLKANPGNLGASYYDFDPLALGRLRKLLDDTYSEVVIHSDYRYNTKLEEFKLLFKIHGMDDYIIDVCNPKEEKDIAIKRYLSRNENDIESYVIFDDDIKINRGFGEHFILTDNVLTDENCKQARKVLERYY